MSAVAESLPELGEATAPAEARGHARDSVRMLALTLPDGEIRHAGFRDLPGMLEPGDLLVINTSGTRPSALDARREDGVAATVHLSGPAPNGRPDEWLIELRDADRSMRDGVPGERLTLPGEAWARLISRHVGGRLWLASLELPEPTDEYLRRHGQPIRYGHV